MSLTRSVGVTLELTESEAKNLNNTNYIKRKKYRNLKVGKQKLNGYQALGYCRIRHGKRMATAACRECTLPVEKEMTMDGLRDRDLPSGQF